ncbi:hypothetical protein AA21952_0346 [Acetobacter oeni LMG 21952]|nr:hypothetical protein AA21952_0346 [Acetobacter oeni LMG 21952]
MCYIELVVQTQLDIHISQTKISIDNEYPSVRVFAEKSMRERERKPCFANSTFPGGYCNNARRGLQIGNFCFLGK